jgi:hypothetical protein
MTDPADAAPAAATGRARRGLWDASTLGAGALLRRRRALGVAQTGSFPATAGS